jgi:hypothetical protein
MFNMKKKKDVQWEEVENKRSTRMAHSNETSTNTHFKQTLQARWCPPQRLPLEDDDDDSPVAAAVREVVAEMRAPHTHGFAVFQQADVVPHHF